MMQLIPNTRMSKTKYTQVAMVVSNQVSGGMQVWQMDQWVVHYRGRGPSSRFTLCPSVRMYHASKAHLYQQRGWWSTTSASSHLIAWDSSIACSETTDWDTLPDVKALYIVIVVSNCSPLARNTCTCVVIWGLLILSSPGNVTCHHHLPKVLVTW